MSGPNERRCIARDSLDYYRGLVVGGTYEFGDASDLSSLSTYTNALQKCADRYPQMSVVVADAQSNSPYFEHYPKLDLEQHVQLLHGCKKNEDEGTAIEKALPGILDTKLLPTIPAWKVFVLTLSEKRCFIAFFYSHTLGDGMSGLAFHQSLLSSLEGADVKGEYSPKFQSKAISPAVDTPQNLPITWSFFLATILGLFLPKSILLLFGIGVSIDVVTSATWTGSPIFYNADKHATGVRTLCIEGEIVNKVLRVCRSHDAKLTGLFHQLIIIALSESLPQTAGINDFAAQTSLSLREALNISGDEIGNFISADTERLLRGKKRNPEAEASIDWASAKTTTERLAKSSKDLRNHPIGLLRFVSDIQSWTSSKIGGNRDCSYEVSNLTRFQPAGPGHKVTIVEMVFCQPASVTGPPLSFNLVSVAKGPLTIAVSWQIGALGLGSDQDETEFVDGVSRKIEIGFKQLASSL